MNYQDFIVFYSTNYPFLSSLTIMFLTYFSIQVLRFTIMDLSGNARIVRNQEKIIEILEENNTYLAQIANNTKMKDECDCFEDEPIDDNDWDMVFRWEYEK